MSVTGSTTTSHPPPRLAWVTALVRRGPWGYVLRAADLIDAGVLPEHSPDVTVATLTDLVTELNAGRIADTSKRDLRIA